MNILQKIIIITNARELLIHVDMTVVFGWSS